MAANTLPIYIGAPQVQWGANITAANTATDGTGTVTTIFTADATDGSRVDMIRIRALGTNVATVLRVFVNNGSTNATAGNNTLIEERTLTATTGTNTAALAPVDIAINTGLPPGYKLNVTIGTAVSAGYAVSAFAGDY
jgi:hypothetical protein